MSKRTFNKQRVPRNTQGWPKVRCCALDDDGKQCRSLAVWRESFHGDPETRDFDRIKPDWVLIHVCDRHSDR